MFLKSLYQLQEGAIVYRKKLQPLKITFGSTCNYTINELFQYDIVIKALERLKILFFSIREFFHNHSRITGLQGKKEGISLTPHYHFHPLRRHLDISRTITAESSPMHIGSSGTRAGRKLLTTKLRALEIKLKFLEE